MENNSTSKALQDSALYPLAQALSAFILPELRAAIRAEILAEHDVRPTLPPKRLYSLRDLGRYYGVGRLQAERDMAAGSLHFVERRCRGGRTGKFVPREEAERVYARSAKG